MQRAAPRLPERAAFALADAIASTLAQCSPVRRAAVEANLRRILPAAGDEARSSPEVFRHFGRYLCEFFRMHRARPRLVIEGRGHLEQSRAGGRGAILLTAHLGNWELGAVTLSRLGFPVSVIARTHPDPRTNALFVRQRQQCGVRVIPLELGVTHHALRSLANGHFLGMLGDRDFMGNGVPVTFGTGSLTIPRGPAVLALRSGAPILRYS
jgi:KDO2-lipid IV(A) lauroyltransferase